MRIQFILVALTLGLFGLALSLQSQQSARFYYEAEFELIKISFNFSLITEPVYQILAQTKLINAAAKQFHLGSRAIEMKSDMIAEIVQNGNSILRDVGDLRDFLDLSSGKNKRESESEIRVERAPFEFMGNLWHDLSGSPGPWEYKKELEAMAKVYKAFSSVSKFEKNTNNEFSIVKSVLQKEQNEIDFLANATQKLVHEYNESISEQILIEIMIGFSSKSLTILGKLRQKIESITGIMEQAKMGLPSIRLISFTDFKEIIHEYERKHKILSPVFDENEVHLYYSIPIVRMIWTGTLDIFIRIPLVDHGHQYHISPINKALGNELSKFDYILTSRDGKTFRFISDAELQKCLKVKNAFISDLRVVESALHRLQCNHLGCHGLNANGDFEIMELTTTSFAFSTKIRQNATLLCKNSHERISLPLEGFISLPVHCSLMTNLFNIDAYPQEHTITLQEGIDKFEVKAITKSMVKEPEGMKYDMAKITDMRHGINEKLKKAEALQNLTIMNLKSLNETTLDLGQQIAIAYYHSYAAYGGMGVMTMVLIISLICICCFLSKSFKKVVKC